MKKNIILAAGAILISFLSGITAWSEALPWPEWPAQGVYRYNNYYLDQNINFANEPMSRRAMDLENDTDSALAFLPPDPARSDARKVALISNLRSGARREEVFEFEKRGTKLRWTGYRGVTRAPDGELVRLIELDATERSLALPEDIYYSNILQAAMIGLEFKPGSELRLQGWNTFQIAYALTVEVGGEEEVTVPAGKFVCYRVTVRPVITDYFGSVVGALVRPFAPEYKMWMMKDAPHVLVRMEGGVAVTPSLAIPMIARELTEMDASGTMSEPAAAEPPAPPEPGPDRRELAYSIAYEESGVEFASRPYAQKILDVDQPATSRVTIAPEALDSGSGRRVLVFEELMRNRSERRTVLSLTGEPPRWTRMWISQQNGPGRAFRREYYDVSNPAFPYPREIICPQALWAGGLDLTPGKETTSFIFMNPTLMSHISIKTEVFENISVPAGSFECAKVTITPWASEYFGSEVGNLVQRFVPSYTLWIETAEPHRIVKHRGILGQMPSTMFIYYDWQLEIK